MKYPVFGAVAVVLGVVVMAPRQAPGDDLEKKLQANIRALGDSKADVDKRIAACAALRGFGAKAKMALPALIEALNDTHSVPRQVTLTDGRPPAVRPTTPVEPTPGPTTIPAAVPSALEELNKAVPKGPVVNPVGPAKGPFGMEDRGLTLRRTALDVIAGLGADAREVVPALVTALKGLPDSKYQDTLGQEDRLLGKLVSTLGEYGPQAKDAIGPLVAVLKGTLQGKHGKRPCGFSCRMKALNALAEIDLDSPEFVGALVRMLDAARTTTETEKKGSLGLELAAVRQLGEVSSPALYPQVLQALHGAQRAKDPALQREATRAAEKVEQRRQKGG
jgi:hypothetical protein